LRIIQRLGYLYGFLDSFLRFYGKLVKIHMQFVFLGSLKVNKKYSPGQIPPKRRKIPLHASF